MIPSSNLFATASRMIRLETVLYYKFDERVVNDIGLDVPVYLPPSDLRASVQAVPRNTYQQLGLDFQKKYITLFCSSDLLDINRDVSGDQIAFNGRQYQCLSATDWYVMDGWKELLCVDVGAATSYFAPFGFNEFGFGFDQGNFGHD